MQAAVADALKTKRSVQLATALQKRGGEAGELKKAYDKVQPLQGNVVDLSKLDLSAGSADSTLVVEWMGSGPGGLTRLILDASSPDVLAALKALVVATRTPAGLSAINHAISDSSYAPRRPIKHSSAIDQAPGRWSTLA